MQKRKPGDQQSVATMHGLREKSGCEAIYVNLKGTFSNSARCISHVKLADIQRSDRRILTLEMLPIATAGLPTPDTTSPAASLDSLYHSDRCWGSSGDGGLYFGWRLLFEQSAIDGVLSIASRLPPGKTYYDDQTQLEDSRLGFPRWKPGPVALELFSFVKKQTRAADALHVGRRLAAGIRIDCFMRRSGWDTLA